MAKYSPESIKAQVDYRLRLIAKLEKAGRTEQAAHQKALHEKRVELSKGPTGASAFWISERDLVAKYPKLAAKAAAPKAPVAAPKAPAVAAKSKKAAPKKVTASSVARPVAAPAAVSESASK